MITDAITDQYIKCQSLSDRTRTGVDIQRDVNKWKGVKMSVWALRRLRGFGLYERLAHKKPLVSLRNRDRRLSFAKDHSDWTVKDWKKVLFTDETKVNLVGSDGKSYITHFKENFNSQFIKGQLQAGCGSILMWGAFCHDDIGPIVQIQNTFNSEKYIELLEETIELFVKENKARRFMYQQNSLVHKSKRVLAWLKQKFKTIDWLPKSPDINPIENLWAIVRRMAKKKCKNTKELYETFVHE